MEGGNRAKMVDIQLLKRQELWFTAEKCKDIVGEVVKYSLQLKFSMALMY